MSSHHFVREGQEPSLLIDTEDIRRFEFFDQLAGWNPVVISTEVSMPSLLLNDIHVDHLILESSGASAWSGLKEHLPHLQIHSGTLSEVLSALMDRFDCPSVQWLTDNEDPLLWDRVAGMVSVTIFNPGIKWVPAPTGVFRAWLSKGTDIRIHGDDVKMDGRPSANEVVVGADGIHSFTGRGLWIGLRL